MKKRLKRLEDVFYWAVYSFCFGATTSVFITERYEWWWLPLAIYLFTFIGFVIARLSGGWEDEDVPSTTRKR